ncbi:MAG TPA: trypsin-like peptidase domain-containing protein [Deltaproteobacteria bacterium]|jgi:S1-C subfamily serine protease|nr:trypsin-like peptidase domain-containing protein [Deltaproteobacteria bacterium]HOI08424.1 trypsin-like peptidase domain-containing protein [Deltaproteobacteria bacterium]
MTESKLDRCPKCSSPVTGEAECKTCGIVFEKYFQAEARRKAMAELGTAHTAHPSASGSRRTAVLVGLVLVSALAVAALFGLRPHVPTGGAGLPGATGEEQESAESSAPSRVVVIDGAPEGGAADQELIQRAVNSTVSVRTPWGSLGSGFFISEHAVVTNKHVVTFDSGDYEELKARVERNRKLIDLEAQKIGDMKERLSQMPEGPSRSQLDLIIQSRESELGKYQAIQKSEEEALAKIKQERDSGNIRIITWDNKEYTVSSVTTSPDHDLALLKVYSVSGQALKRSGDEDRLEPGQVVYAIGSPLGLSNTVTSGIFSAYRKKVDTGERYIQIDAAINPGNSGGPLIDARGNVLGVNTLGLSNTQGIGFAIPIGVVFEDFSSLL